MSHGQVAWGRTLPLTLIGLLLFVFVAEARADVLRLRDGRTYEGKLVSRDGTKVVFRVIRGNASMTMEFAAATVLEIELTPDDASPDTPEAEPAKPKADPAEVPLAPREGFGEPYYVLPIHGRFGLEVSWRIVDECLRAARAVKAKTVVLEIDSPGGAVAELKAVLDVLDHHSDLRVIAYVNEAKSCAAILALSCREIVMHERGTMGAATAYQVGPDGTPQNIEEKFESSVRADFRAAAERGGHDALLVEGMMRTDLVLSLKRDGARYRIVEGSGELPLKKKGEILTLTTKEAVRCGVALGSANRIQDAAQLLKIREWYDVTDHGRKRTRLWCEEVRAAEEKFANHLSSMQASLLQANIGIEQRCKRDVTSGLRKAEMHLRRMEELAEKFPALGDQEAVRDMRKQLRVVREAIEKM